MNPEVPTAAVDVATKIGTGVTAATEGGAPSGVAAMIEGTAAPEVAASAAAPAMEQMGFQDIGGADFVDSAAQQAAASTAPTAEAEIQGLVDKFTQNDFDDATIDRLADAENAGNLKWENGQPIVNATPVEAPTAAPDGEPVTPPATETPTTGTAAPAAEGADAEGGDAAPEDAGADLTDTETPVPPDAEPESVRDQLTSRIATLKSEANPTPEQQRELTKANLELAERDMKDTLNAAEPDSLSAEDAAQRDKLNEKYGTPNAQAAAEDTIPDQPAAEAAQEPVDPGEFNEQAIRDQIEADRNRRDWTQDQKDAYVNSQRAEHDQKKADYDKAVEAKGQERELTTEQTKQKLDKELQQVQQDLIDGKITAQEASRRLSANRNARELIVKSLVERFTNGEEMTPFEKEVAEKSIQMQQLMREIQMAPKVMTAMEQTIKKLKAEYKKAAGYQITPQNADNPDTRQNVALRSQLSNQIAAQATHMARYADITAINVNEFKSVNSSLMTLIGVRGGFKDMLVQIGTGIRRKAKTYSVDIKARNIAQGFKA